MDKEDESTDMSCVLDHLVIGASSLIQGIEWFHQLSRISMPAGGVHPRMGTHNHISAMSQATFIEIISIDENSTPPDRRRWFALDDAVQVSKLQQQPRLLTWVVGTDNLDAAINRASAVGIDAGEPIEMTRGDLVWRLSIRSDGSLVEGGTFPILIEWPRGRHPASNMVDQGIRCAAIKLAHPEPEFLRSALIAIGADGLVELDSKAADEPAIGAALLVGKKRISL